MGRLIAFVLFLVRTFFTGFFAADLAGFLITDFLLFFAVFFKNLPIATIPPEGAKVMACCN